MSKKMLDTAHEVATGLYNAGVIDAATMREYDKLCLVDSKQACRSLTAETTSTSGKLKTSDSN